MLERGEAGSDSSSLSARPHFPCAVRVSIFAASSCRRVNSATEKE